MLGDLHGIVHVFRVIDIRTICHVQDTPTLEYVEAILSPYQSERFPASFPMIYIISCAILARHHVECPVRLRHEECVEFLLRSLQILELAGQEGIPDPQVFLFRIGAIHEMIPLPDLRVTHEAIDAIDAFGKEGTIPAL